MKLKKDAKLINLRGLRMDKGDFSVITIYIYQFESHFMMCWVKTKKF